MRRVIFTSRKIPNNSFKMRGEQICDALQQIGYNCIIMKPEELESLSGNIIIWVRRAVHLMSRKLCRRNIIVYDPLDRIDELYKYGLYRYVHAIIFPSQFQHDIEDERTKMRLKFVLYHHYDPRIQLREYNKFDLGYFGYSTSADHTRNLINKANRYSSTRTFPYDFFERISCHYNVRTVTKGFGWRPTTKISTAAGAGCNIITSRDKMSEELLPPDYPYWVDNSANIDEVRYVIEKAKDGFGNERWNYGLKCMSAVRELTNIEVCAKQYGKILERIDANWPA